MQLLFSVVLLSAFVAPSLQAKKKDNRKFVLDVNDIKPFKKLLRTNKNLLVLYAKSEKDATKKFSLLGEVAMEIKGKGTIAFVNCGDNKKLCKKLKVSPKPLLLKHYKDGEFNKDYDRKDTLKSMVYFLNNPTGDAPWEEELGADDVLHLQTPQDLNKLLTKEKKPILIMFYAPWCGFCKRFKPEYGLAATELKDDAVLVGMDVDTEEGYSVRMHFNITGFPTTIYFEKGKEMFRYSGKPTKDALVEWMRNPSAAAPAEKDEEEAWSDTPSDVVHLKDDTFDDFVSQNPSVLVMFYAPWCGHCKSMKPEYTEAAKTLKEGEVTGVLAAVDSTKEPTISKRYKVEGYPTVKYFKDGKLAFDVNERKGDKIVEFMKDPKEPPPPPPPEQDWSEVASEVNHLTDSTFKSFLKKKKHALIMFYAPWCGHCKTAKPELMTAAKHHKDNTKIAYAGVDCTKDNPLCEKFGVQGFPTFRYFNYGKKDFKYTSGRKAQDFIQFMDDPNEGPPPPPPEPQWSDEPSNVHHLTESNFEDTLKAHESVLVMFYAPWCGHCKRMKPAYAEAAEEMLNTKIDGILAAVDCTKEKSIAKKYDVSGFPTIKYYRNGKFASEYSKSRSKDDLVDFMKNHGDTASATPEKPKEKTWSEESKDVFHLTADTYEEFVSTHASVLAMFYTPWCPHCQKLKPDYDEAAKEVGPGKSIDGALAAIDCTVSKALCTKQEVKGYPTLQYIKSGEFQFKYTGRRTAQAFIDFMKDPKKPEPPPPPADWSKEDSKVMFLTDDNHDEFINNNKYVLVMYFAPWCGHCNSMKPNYYKAAQVLHDENANCKLAAVDGTKHRKVAKASGLSGYPTIKLYKDGKAFKEYEGDRSEKDLVQFMRLSPGEDAAKEVEESSLIKRLDSDTFKDFIAETEHVLVMFFAPWCGHCKNAKPKYERAAEEFKDQPQRVFAAVDCTKDGSLCDKEDVNGYPTLKYYNYGKFVVEYDGDRITEDFISFMEEPPIPLPDEKPTLPLPDEEPAVKDDKEDAKPKEEL